MKSSACAFRLFAIALAMQLLPAVCGFCQALTLAEGLDTPGVVWITALPDTWTAESATDAHDGEDVVNIPELTMEEALLLSTTVTGPAVVKFWWRYVSAVTDPAMYAGVDGAFVRFYSQDADPAGWVPVEIQLAAGSHTVSFYPFTGTRVQLDEVTITPGPGQLLKAGPAVAAWMVPGAAEWIPGPAAPPGTGEPVAWDKGGTYPVVHCLLPEGSKYEGWFRMPGRGYLWMAFGNNNIYYPARRESPEWQRFRGVAADRWLTLGVQGEPVDGDTGPALAIAGLSASPAGPGDIVDAPELQWTSTGLPGFSPRVAEPVSLQTLSLHAGGPGAFSSSLHTSVTGPGRLYFSTAMQLTSGDRWDVFLNGQKSRSLEGASDGTWLRYGMEIPPGAAALEFRGANADAAGEPDDGSFFIDDVTLCVAANAGQRDALDLPAEADMWVRQAGAAQWTRSTTDSRDGVDALALAPSSSGLRLADLMLPAEGSMLAGVWIKTDPLTEILVSPFQDGRRIVSRSIRPVVDAGWTWMPMLTGTDVSEVRLTVVPASDQGRAVFLDRYATYNTEVSAAEALETPGITWAGKEGLALPGSDATGEKAVLLTRGRSLASLISTPARVRFRYRFCVSEESGEASVQVAGRHVTAFNADQYNPQAVPAWQEAEFIEYQSWQSAALTFNCNLGSLLLDRVQVEPLGVTTIAEGLDAPGITIAEGDANGWTGISGVGHDGQDAVVSPELSGYNSTTSGFEVTGPPSGSVDGSFWWWRQYSYGGLTFLTSLDPEYPGEASYLGDGWQRVRVHCDRPAATLRWVQSRPPWGGSPMGHIQLDELLLTSGPEYSFSKALDTDQPGPGGALTGWDSAGEAVASVQTADTWQDGDALQIRAAPGGHAVQTTRLTARFMANTEFSCRVKRGVHAAVTLTLMAGRQAIAAASLTTEWAEWRVILPVPSAAETWITLEASVADGGADSVIYLDAVSVGEAKDFNAALESSGLAWTATGDGRQLIAGFAVPANGEMPPYFGNMDGVALLDLANGQRRRLSTVMTGPGVAVFTGYRPFGPAVDWQVSLSVDGIIGDLLNPEYSGAFQLQAFIPAGTHAVSWQVKRGTAGSEDPAELHLHSVALVTGTPAALLPPALQAIAPGRPWNTGSTGRPALPLYRLTEGEAAVHGVFFPAGPAGESSWVETSVAGPARLSFTWQSTTTAACYVDGLVACLTVPEPDRPDLSDPRTELHLPSGTHTVRWASSQGFPAELRAITFSEGSDIAAVIGNLTPPVIWHYQPGYPWFTGWQVMDDGAMDGFFPGGEMFEVPGTGLPVLAAGDESTGAFWVTGPAVVSFEVRRAVRVPLVVNVGDTAYLSEIPIYDDVRDRAWHPDAAVVPAGPHKVSLMVAEDSSGSSPYVCVKNVRVEPGLRWVTWAYGIGLVDIMDSSPYADPDHDGINNLMEYAFGTQPLAWNPPVGPVLTGSPENLRLQFPALPWDATGLKYDVEVSASLDEWTSYTVVSPNAADRQGPSVLLPADTEGRRFYRVTVRL